MPSRGGVAQLVDEVVGVRVEAEVEALPPDLLADPRQEIAVAQLLAEVGDVGEEHADPAVSGERLRGDHVPRCCRAGSAARRRRRGW